MKFSKREWTVFGIICLIGIFANLDKSMIGFTANKLISTYGFTKTEVGNLSSVFYLSFILVTIPGGWFVDRFGYKKFVVASLSILMLFSFLFGNASGLFSILLIRFFVGFGQAGYTNGGPKIISDNFAPEQCAKVQSIVVGTAGIGGILASTIGQSIINVNWHYAYYMLSIGYLLALVLVIIFLKENNISNKEIKEKSQLVEKVGFFDAWKNKNILLLSVAILFCNLASVAMMFWLPNVLHVNFNIQNPSMLSTIMVGFYIVMTISTGISGSIITKYFKGKEQKFIFVVSIITSIGIVVFISAPIYQVAITALYVSDFTMMLAFSALVSMPYQIVPRKMIGSAFSVLNIGAFIGGIISPQLVSSFATSNSYFISFIVLAICILISGATTLLLKNPEELLNEGQDII